MTRSVVSTVVAVVILSGAGLAGAADPGDCLTSEEVVLLQAINDYRVDEGHGAVPWSKSLTEVAQWHVWDLETNHPDAPAGCNLHSWSDQGSWTEVCYTADHAQASLMWSKPNEITGGVYSAAGYEIAYYASAGATAGGALAAWKASPGHNDVILNQGVWVSRDPWPAMGAGIFGDYAVVWFGDMTDPRGSITVCVADEIFADGFESGNTSVWTRTFP